MCGRTACTLAPDDVCKACSYQDKQGLKKRPVWRDPPNGKQYYPSYNVSPGTHTPVLLSSAHYGEELTGITDRVIQPMQWGLVPSWHKGDPKKVSYETNNCRAEGMLEKRTFKVPLEKGRRCVILADGFYEWKRDQSSKQPYYIYFPKTSSHADDKKQLLAAPKQESKEENKQEVLNDEKNSLKMEIVSESEVKHEVFGATKIKLEPVDNMDLLPVDEALKNESISNPGVDKALTSIVKTEDMGCTENGSTGIVKTEDMGCTEKGSTGIVKSKDLHNPVIDNGQHDSTRDEEQNKYLLTMAGVFDIWTPPDGSAALYSYSVITVSASPAMDWLHHRMPAILTTDQETEDWLDTGNVPLNKAVKCIRPVECIQLHPVSTVVNNSRNKTPDCITPVDLKKPKLSASRNMMMNWLAKPKPEKTTEDHRSQDSPPKKKRKSENSLMSWLSKGKSPQK